MSASGPNDEDRVIDALRLALVPGIGPRLQRALLDFFGDASTAIKAGIRELKQVPGIGPKLVESIVDHRESAAAELELEACQERDIRIILAEDEDYPRLLREIHDAPNVLYCRGTLEPRDELAIAIVGARRCTHYGTKHAEQFAATLGRAGMTVVSGLARGIDAAAHRGALNAGGRTVAVTASGVWNIYPPEHKELADEIVKNGAILSEFPIDQKMSAGLFPQRNRIISGMSSGVIVAEASKKSGALHTARHAMEQGRDVFAIPGPIDSPVSQGCHDLIRDGAGLARHVDDVIESIGPFEPVQVSETEVIHSARELTLSDQEREVINLVGTEALHMDQLLQSTDLPAHRVMSTLTMLEMKRLVRKLPGGYFIRGN